jgi:N-methylhydantoinase B/oxoprolinase/acetone carboxylase alpha subunit
LDKIQSLEKLVKNGIQDEVMVQTLDKLIRYEEHRQKEEIERLEKERKVFEEKYNMDSETFHVKFHRGELGDQTDFFEWDALCEMYKKTLKGLNILKGKA